MTVSINTAPRKCGDVKKGGAYGGAEQAQGGILRSAWLVGEMWEGAESPCIPVGEELPYRTQIEINPRASLNRGTLTDASYIVMHGDHPTSIEQWGLADHVGEAFYKTPYSFAKETIARGPNRRVTLSNAKLWADNVPFPVLFVHNKVPVFKSQLQAEKFLSWASAHEWIEASKLRTAVNDWADRNKLPDLISMAETMIEWRKALARDESTLCWRPTWEGQLFGMHDKADTGKGHLGVCVLEALNNIGKHSKIPEDLRPDFDRAVFFASWFTYIAVAVEDESEFDDDLSQYGIEAGIMTTPTP